MSSKTFCSKKIGIYTSEFKKALKARGAPADLQGQTPDLPQLSWSLSGSFSTAHLNPSCLYSRIHPRASAWLRVLPESGEISSAASDFPIVINTSKNFWCLVESWLMDPVRMLAAGSPKSPESQFQHFPEQSILTWCTYGCSSPRKAASKSFYWCLKPKITALLSCWRSVYIGMTSDMTPLLI